MILFVAGPAGPSHVHAQANARGRRLQRTQAVAVRESAAPSRQTYADAASRTALAGLKWAKDKSEAWQSESKGPHSS